MSFESQVGRKIIFLKCHGALSDSNNAGKLSVQMLPDRSLTCSSSAHPPGNSSRYDVRRNSRDKSGLAGSSDSRSSYRRRSSSASRLFAGIPSTNTFNSSRVDRRASRSGATATFTYQNVQKVCRSKQARLENRLRYRAPVSIGDESSPLAAFATAKPRQSGSFLRNPLIWYIIMLLPGIVTTRGGSIAHAARLTRGASHTG
jgi:hypothetical protein